MTSEDQSKYRAQQRALVVANRDLPHQRIATILEGRTIWGVRSARNSAGDWPATGVILSALDAAASYESDLEITKTQPLRFREEALDSQGWECWFVMGDVWKVRPEVRDEQGWETFSTLLLAARQKRIASLDRQLRQAQKVLTGSVGAEGTFERRAIPGDVKLFVWQRDRGVCQECGSNRDLEFDHIIPVAMGGSNTARNLQLLCEPCNRAKGASIA